MNRSFEQLPAFSVDIRSQGYNPVYKVISFDMANTDSNIRQKLNMANDKVIRFKRVMYLNEDPIAVVCSYLNTDIFPDFKQQDLGSSLYASPKNKTTLPEARWPQSRSHTILRLRLGLGEMTGLEGPGHFSPEIYSNNGFGFLALYPATSLLHI